jgi:hypothetical protein
MFYFRRHKKIILTVVIATLFCLVLSSFPAITLSQTINDFTLPCTISTYGNAWNGLLAYDLEISSGFMGVGGIGNYFVVMDTSGNVLALRQSSTSYGGSAYNIAPYTLMFEGEPQEGGAQTAPTFATHFWNLSTGTTQDFPNVISEHDIQYNPVNNTFLTLQDYIRQVGNSSILFDKIVQVDPNGNVLWSWDTYDHIPLSEASPFNETSVLNGQKADDFTHANTLDWFYNDSIIFLNVRNTNTFYKINQTSGDIIWACGEFGNFTLLGDDGQPLVGANGLPPSLWYHSHDTKQVAPDVFTMFDNDFDNNTNPNNCRSRMIELTVNETSMTAYVNWSWEAPTQYWNNYACGTLLLPNGDFLGDFGDPTHQLPQNSPWNFNNTGAVFIEVNPAGQIVKKFTFPVDCYVYRIAMITNPTSIIFPTPTLSLIQTPVPFYPTTIPTHITNPTSTPTITPTPKPIVTQTPSAIPTPTVSTNFQPAIIIIALTIIAVVVVALGAIFYIKRTCNHKN